MFVGELQAFIRKVAGVQVLFTETQTVVDSK
jgi:hypothetical protein